MSRVVAPPAGRRTLEFIENTGQWDAKARYAAQLPGGRLFLEPGGFTYNFVAGLPQHRSGKKAPAARGQIANSFRAHAVRMRFEGASSSAALHAESPTGTVTNYLSGNDATHWGRQARGFRAVHYTNLWKGIGLRVYENHGQHLEYDFELAAGASPAQLKLRYEGTSSMHLAPDGSLQVETSAGNFQEMAPVAYQLSASGQRQPVTCAYELQGQTVGFRLGKYDLARPLTIDPTVVFSSFTGATSDNWGFTATYDAQGNLYSGGISFNTGYPVTSGAYDPAFSGTVDMAFIKYNPTVSGPAARVWATYLGGTSADFPHSLVTNKRGELVVLGTTSSLNYPTTDNALDRTFNGGTYLAPYGYPEPYALIRGSDLVLSRLSANGDSLLASTYLGGGANDGVLNPEAPTPRLVRNYGDYFRGDVLLDATGNVYIASSTSSADFPQRNGTGAMYGGGPSDALTCQLSPDLRTLRWSNLLGGNSADAAYSLQLDKKGSLYVTGGTASTNFPTTTGALQPRLAGDVDAFVAKISPGGTTLEKATYLGTSAYDQAYFLQLDLAGEVYLLGQTRGTIAISAGRYGVPRSGQYVQKLSADLSALRFATVFGSGRGNIDLSPTAFLVDQCDRVYISGWGGGPNTPSTDFGFTNDNTRGLPLTPNALQRTTDDADFYLAQFSPGMQRLEYATYLGNNTNTLGYGDHVDGGTSRFDPKGIVYQAVCACGQDGPGFPVPPGANTYQRTNGAVNCNNAAFKLPFETVFITTSTDTLVCLNGGAVRLTGSPAGGTWSGPGVSGSAGTGYVFNPSPALVGFQTLTYSVPGIAVCGGAVELRLRVVPAPPSLFVPPPQTGFCVTDAPIKLTAAPAGGTFSGPGVREGNLFDPKLAGTGTHQLTYTYQYPGGPSLLCPATGTFALSVSGEALATSVDTLACVNGPPVRLLGVPSGGIWSGPGVSGSAATGFVFTPVPALLGFQTLLYTVTSGTLCTGAVPLRVRVVPLPTVTIAAPPQTNFCLSDAPVQLTSSPTGGTFSGPGMRENNVFDPKLAGAGTHQITYSYAEPSERNVRCPGIVTLALIVTPTPQVQLPPDTVLCPGSTISFRLRAQPQGGTWVGEGVSGSTTGGYTFTPPADIQGREVALTYTLPTRCSAPAEYRISGGLPFPFLAFSEPVLCTDNTVAPLRMRFTNASALNDSRAGSVTWDFGDGSPPVVMSPASTPVEHTYTQPGTYQPRATLSHPNLRCLTQSSPPVVTVKAQFLPNIFTPNGDLLNAKFAPVVSCSMRLRVFTRWGQQVYEQASYANQWTGDGLPSGLYYYLLDDEDGQKLKGWVQIVR